MKNAAVADGRAAPHPTVLVADDHALVREGLKTVAAATLGSTRFLEAHDGDSLLHAARQSPEIRLALVALRMPGMHGGARLFELARRHPHVPIVVIAALSSRDVASQVLRIPTVHAFLPRAASSGSLRSAIEAAMHGRKLAYEDSRSQAAQQQLALTPRQQQIRGLLRQGMRNKMIAQVLGISEGTVKNHVTDILKILKASNRTQAAQLHEGE
ncbi:MAG TPA: response regulator transcription factor [Steroidobacteraceae bacterium]|nr:response regulator transcription factor [Steroidobacteraceae bacterium]